MNWNPQPADGPRTPMDGKRVCLEENPRVPMLTRVSHSHINWDEKMLVIILAR